MVDISSLLSDQPLVDESGTDQDIQDQLDGALDTSIGDDLGVGDEPPAGESDPPPARNQKVPLAALHEERTKRQELEQRSREQQALIDKANDRLAKLFDAQQQAQQPPPVQEAPPPSFIDDPEGAFNHVQQQLANTQRQMQEYLHGVGQQQQQQAQRTQLAQQVSTQEAAFTTAVPDYPQAADYFYQRKVAEYTAFTGDEFAAKQQVTRDYEGIAVLAQRLGKNPAELMYNAAKAMGYAPGQVQQRAPAAQRRPNTSLGDLQGSTRAPDERSGLTTADIADMSEAEFDKLWNSVSKGGVARPKI